MKILLLVFMTEIKIDLTMKKIKESAVLGGVAEEKYFSAFTGIVGLLYLSIY